MCEIFGFRVVVMAGRPDWGVEYLQWPAREVEALAMMVVCEECGRVYEVREDSGLTHIECSCGLRVPVPGAAEHDAGAQEVAEAVSAPAEVERRERAPREWRHWLAVGASGALGLVLGWLSGMLGETELPLWVARVPEIPLWGWFAGPAVGAGIARLLAPGQPVRGMSAALGVVVGTGLGLGLFVGTNSYAASHRLIFRGLGGWLDWHLAWTVICGATAALATLLTFVGARFLPGPDQAGGTGEARAPAGLRVVAALLGAAIAAEAFTVAGALPVLRCVSRELWTEPAMLASIGVLCAIIGAGIGTAAVDVCTKHRLGSAPYLGAIGGVALGLVIEGMLGYSGVPMLACLIALPVAGAAFGMATSTAIIRDGYPRRVALATLLGGTVALGIAARVYYPSPEAVRARLLIEKARDPQQREEALGELRQIKEPNAVPALIRGLRHENREIVAACARALGGTGDGRAVKPLIAVMERETGTVRRQAAVALAAIGDERAVGPLLELLKSDDAQGVSVAKTALGKLGPAAVAPVMALLKEEDEELRARAAEALGRTQDPRVVPKLLEALEHGSEEERCAAAWALRTTHHERALEPLVRALRDDSSKVRRAAAAALGAMKDPRGVEPLIEALTDEGEWVAMEAAEALGKIRTERAVDALIGALGDDDWHVVQAAAQGLGSIGGKKAVAALVDLLRYEAVHTDHGRHAVNPLANMTEEAIEPVWELVRDPHPRVRENAELTLSALCNALPQYVEPELSDADPHVRAVAARLMGPHNAAGTPEPLVPLLGDEVEEVRKAAADSLQSMGEAAVKPLIAGLDSEKADARREAVRVLGVIGDARATEPLLGILKGEGSGARVEAARAVGSIGDERAVEPLIEVLTGPGPDLRAAAAGALGEIKDARAVEPLIGALSDQHEPVRRAAYPALSKIGKPAVPALIEALETGDRRLHLGVRNALRNIDDPRAKEALEPDERRRRRGPREPPMMP